MREDGRGKRKEERRAETKTLQLTTTTLLRYRQQIRRRVSERKDIQEDLQLRRTSRGRRRDRSHSPGGRWGKSVRRKKVDDGTGETRESLVVSVRAEDCDV